MKKIWNYDPVSKEISGAGYADPDPLENPNEDLDGVWAIPAYATTVEPPAVVDGYVRVFNEAERIWGYVLAAAPIGTVPAENPEDIPEPEPEVPTKELVNLLRDAKIRNGFYFEGRIYQSDDESRENILGVGAAASAAIMAGAQPGDLRWGPEPDEDFFFIDREDVRVVMDAFTAQRFALSLMARKSKLIIAANNLKKRDPIPADYDDDAAYWPPMVPASEYIPPGAEEGSPE